MIKMLVVICLLTTLILAGCATTKVLQPINGSKSDGTVTLAYEYGIFEDPQIDWKLANNTAKARCAAWGYRNSQAFSGGESHCLSSDRYGNCTQVQVNVVYQCTK